MPLVAVLVDQWSWGMMGSCKGPEVHSEAWLPVTDTLRSTCTCHLLHAHRRLLNQGFTNIFKVLYKEFINR